MHGKYVEFNLVNQLWWINHISFESLFKTEMLASRKSESEVVFDTVTKKHRLNKKKHKNLVMKLKFN